MHKHPSPEPHLHDDPDYLRLGEKRAETKVSRSLMEIVEPDKHGALLRTIGRAVSIGSSFKFR